MAKAYWVVCYREIKDAGRLAEYGKLAGPAIIQGGGTILARGPVAAAYEHGLTERVVLIEFPDVETARAAHDGTAYQAALAALGDAAIRDMRIVEGLS